MAESRIPGSHGTNARPYITSPCTPGSWGLNDQGDPNVFALLGDTPGPVGVGDRAASPLCSAEDLEDYLRREPDLGRAAEQLRRVSGLPAQPGLARWQLVSGSLGEADEL